MPDFLVNAAVQNYNASRRTQTTITFTGAAQHGQVGSNVAVFDVSGLVIVRAIVAYGGPLTGGVGATLKLGTVVTPTQFHGATLVSDADGSKGALWSVATFAKSGALETACKDFLVTTDDSIIITPGVTDTTAGGLVIVALWDPLDASVLCQLAAAS